MNGADPPPPRRPKRKIRLCSGLDRKIQVEHHLWVIRLRVEQAGAFYRLDRLPQSSSASRFTAGRSRILELQPVRRADLSDNAILELRGPSLPVPSCKRAGRLQAAVVLQMLVEARSCLIARWCAATSTAWPASTCCAASPSIRPERHREVVHGLDHQRETVRPIVAALGDEPNLRDRAGPSAGSRRA
jgi:hypothetical protein